MILLLGDGSGSPEHPYLPQALPECPGLPGAAFLVLVGLQKPVLPWASLTDDTVDGQSSSSPAVYATLKSREVC